ncbi:type II toxin-antitoxin system VapC family toxin [Roseomonas sp. ACRSG]|nr:type II toxin-antitoxin system VapC family toxin [Roseomonas sp. ACRSG]
MRLLLDTHLLLWALATPERLDAATRAALEDPDNEVLFSAASLWEIAIKAGLGRPDFAFDPAQILRAALDTGFVELPVRSAAAIQVAGLPPHHRDPFDRLLIAQAMSEPVRFYTADPLLPPYSELVTFVG